ncbi:M20/M25/M40 family metallo-hydrolase [Amycolatopsis sp. cg5]|uniref:M20/M25/M40 family metallo-hydrolase n=1 Tax=Amycolatopsis sp. cg5 TaxID=3238802 RepID=UPI003524F149
MRGADRELLLGLLELPTAGPLETDGPVSLREAMERYAAAATAIGFSIVRFAAPDRSAVLRPDVPVPVREAVLACDGFLERQPSLVLRLGPSDPAVMFNVHLDTVAGIEPVSYSAGRFHGRGAIDAKGPAVALLAGIRAARTADPRVGEKIGVLIQVVSGEEGGALGTIGTRPLIEAGFHGRVNVFCEPTGSRFLTRCSAAMTARVRIDGDDSIDDEPHAGHNATVLLGFLAQHLASALGKACPPDGQVCVAGLRTGPLHNRVYGTGELLLNLSYGSDEAATRWSTLLEKALDEGISEFCDRFCDIPAFTRTVVDAARIVRLDWLKRGIPALPPTEDGWAADLLAPLPRWPADEPAFTCDAVWMAAVPGARTVIVGPGSLGANNAHASGEYADEAELDGFSGVITELLTRFAAKGVS